MLFLSDGASTVETIDNRSASTLVIAIITIIIIIIIASAAVFCSQQIEPLSGC